MAGVCQVGDVLGLVDGDFAVIGSDLVEVANAVVDRMLGCRRELVTARARARTRDRTLAEAVVAARTRDPP